MRKRDGKPQGGDGRKGGPMWMGRSVGGSKSALRREDRRPVCRSGRLFSQPSPFFTAACQGWEGRHSSACYS